MQEAWSDAIRRLFKSHESGPLQMAGVGNPIRTDDGVGLYIVSKLVKERLSKPIKGVKILPPNSRSESVLSKLNPQEGKVLIFDAVECNREPGSIVVADLNDTEYGFFATHNIPLRLVPTLRTGAGSVFVLGIQPESTEIGEYLTPVVKTSADTVVETVRAYRELD